MHPVRCVQTESIHPDCRHVISPVIEFLENSLLTLFDRAWQVSPIPFHDNSWIDC